MSLEKKSKDLTLDPENWDQMRVLGHRMIDDLFDYWEGIREEKIWKPIPAEVKEFLDQPIPENGQDPEASKSAKTPKGVPVP